MRCSAIALSLALASPVFADVLTWQPISMFQAHPLIEYDGSLVTTASGGPLAFYDSKFETWTLEDPLVQMQVFDLIVYDGTFFAAGQGDGNIKRRTDSAWVIVGGGMNGFVYAMTEHEGDLIAGGGFTEAGGSPANHIARWDGVEWTALGDGFNDHLRTVTVHNGLLVAGGLFTEADGKPINHVAAWDGESWQPLGDGLDGTVWALISHQGQLFAGGEFPAGVAVWNGATWQPVAGGVDGFVYSLARYQGDWVAGGPVALIVHLQDGVWQDISSGFNGHVIRLHEFDGELFAVRLNGPVWRYGSGSFTWGFASVGTFSGTHWLGPAGHSMFTAPGVHDRAIFNYPSAPTINFTQDHATDRLIMRKGNVTFDLNGYHYEQLNPSFVTPSLLMGFAAGDSATLNVTNGTMHSTYGSIGESPGSFGLLNLDGPTTTMNIGQALWAGWQGVGLIEVENGATLDTGDLTVAAAIGSFGDVAMTGPGTSLYAEWSAYVGDGGFGFLDVLDGAECIAGDMTVANKEGSVGEVLISGAGSMLHVQNDLRIAWRGEGMMSVEQGAALQVDDAILLNFGVPQTGVSHGSLFIRGEGSAATVGGSVAYGPSIGGAEVLLAEGGRLIVGDSISSSSGSSRIITFEFSGADDYVDEPAITVANEAGLPNVEVRLLEGYEPQIGDEFRLVAAASILGPNMLDLPELPEELQWKITQQPTQLTLEVIGFLPGDINSDGQVNTDDLLILLNNWGVCPDPDDCPADLTGDGQVGTDDLLILLIHWTA